MKMDFIIRTLKITRSYLEGIKRDMIWEGWMANTSFFEKLTEWPYPAIPLGCVESTWHGA